MPESDFNPKSTAAGDPAAAGWFIRRERGLSAAEQLQYESWLRESPRHATAIAQLEQVWKMMDPVFAGPAVQGAVPHRDLLAPPKRRQFRLGIPLLFGAAAAAFLLLLLRPSTSTPAPERPALIQGRVIVHPAPERLTLADGSLVDLNAGAKVDVQFTPAERRVTLVRGEAYFTVAKNPARPFIVSAGRVSVRAIGTAFTVGRGQGNVSVLVTEGKVGVNEVRSGDAESTPATHELSTLVAGQKGVVYPPVNSNDSRAWEVRVTQLTAAQVESALLWQGLRLEFADMPLSEIVADFNRYNRRKLVVGDAATAGIRVGGSFRVDNIDGFVRLLSVGFAVSAFPNGDELILRKTGP